MVLYPRDVKKNNIIWTICDTGGDHKTWRRWADQTHIFLPMSCDLGPQKILSFWFQISLKLMFCYSFKLLVMFKHYKRASLKLETSWDPAWGSIPLAANHGRTRHPHRLERGLMATSVSSFSWGQRVVFQKEPLTCGWNVEVGFCIGYFEIQFVLVSKSYVFGGNSKI